MVDERNCLDSNQRRIVKMTTILEELIEKHDELIIIQADKGYRTILMEKCNLNKIIEIFIQKQVINGLYEQVTEVGEEIKIKLIKEMAMLRLRVSNSGEWKTRGIFVDRGNKNMAIEEEFWKGIRAVDNKIPNMIFTIKAHKKPMALRNICPKNKAITYGVNKVVATIPVMDIRIKFDEMGFEDHNIYNAIEWARKKIEGTKIDDNEQMVTVDVKEMFNNINTGLLLNFIKININGKCSTQTSLWT